MSRRYRRKDSGTFITFLILLGIIEVGYYHNDLMPYVPYIVSALTGLVLIRLAFRIYKKIQLRRRQATLEEVDYMSGLEFEQYIANLLRKNGFKKISLTEKFDYGVDIVAEKDGERWGIQTKRYNGLVKAAAVRQVVAGLNSYNCDKAMVITNSNYSKFAINLARSNHCILIDRVQLADLIQKAS